MFVANCGDPIRALAFAALEGLIAPDVNRFRLIHPGGQVRLVPADRYQAEALPEYRKAPTGFRPFWATVRTLRTGGPNSRPMAFAS